MLPLPKITTESTGDDRLDSSTKSSNRTFCPPLRRIEKMILLFEVLIFELMKDQIRVFTGSIKRVTDTYFFT